jgi:hypothetical protein
MEREVIDLKQLVQAADVFRLGLPELLLRQDHFLGFQWMLHSIAGPVTLR